jgi:hypothetical protein
LAKKVTLILTSDLFDVSLLLLPGTKSYFLEEATPTSMDKTAKLAKFSEMAVQRNSSKGCNPQMVSIPQILRGTSAVQPPEAVQKDCTNEGTSLDTDGVNYVRPLKVTKAERF